MKRYHQLLILAILILAFCLRLYKLDNPVADWHSWRQADTAAVTRNFSKFGFDLLRPRFDDLSNIPSGKDNLQGYRFVEVPIYNAIAYILSILFKQLTWSLEIWQRIVSIIASLFSIYLLFLIVEKYASRLAGLGAAFFLAVLPYSVYYSRVILPEPLLVAFCLAALYFVPRSLFLAAIFASLALLIKPVAGFMVLPAGYLLFSTHRFDRRLFLSVILGAVIVLLPFWAWRSWIGHFPEGIPDWRWLLNSDGIRFKGAFFYWLFAERFGKLILGYWGAALLVLGILATSRFRHRWFFHCWAVAIGLYLVILATGNVKHDYYQVFALPLVAAYLGIGSAFLLKQAGSLFSRPLVFLLLPVIIFFTLAFSWYTVRTYYWVNNPFMVAAGKEVDRLVPGDAKVIAPYGGDTAFLYQTNRQGWPIGFEIEDKIRKGATHYVSLDPNDPEAVRLEREYQLLKKTQEYVVIELIKK